MHILSTKRTVAIAAAAIAMAAFTISTPVFAQGTPAAAKPAGTSPSYSPRLKALTDRLQSIQDRLKAASERIQRLRNYMVKNVNPAARLVVRFEDRMGSAFEPLSVLVYLDGVKVASWTKAQGTVKQGGKHLVLNKEVTLGKRQLKVLASYKGTGGMPYMKDFAYKLNRTYAVDAKGGQITTVVAYGYQRGDATYDPSQRPWIGFNQTAVEYSQTNARRLAPAPEPPSKPVTTKTGAAPSPPPPAKPIMPAPGASSTPLPVKAPEPSPPVTP